MTIHSAFYKLKEEKISEEGKRELIFSEAHYEGELSHALLLLDECSMINEAMAQDLIRTGAKIIACGDPGQLPPVEGKQFFSKPDITLQTIHRQALESPIIRQAHAVRQGKPYEADGDAFRVARHGELTPNEKVDADIILCWTNATKRAINRHVRELRGFQFMGVRVQNVNFEGVKTGLPPGVKATTWFDFGYALTVHKAQGSEWGNVILIDEYRRKEERKEWLYTGITRAANKITIIR